MTRVRTRFANDKVVVLVTETALPLPVDHDVKEAGQRLLVRHQDWLGPAKLHVYVKRNGSRVACHARLSAASGLFPTGESYHGFEVGRSMRHTIGRAIDTIDTQITSDEHRHAFSAQTALPSSPHRL